MHSDSFAGPAAAAVLLAGLNLGEADTESVLSTFAGAAAVLSPRIDGAAAGWQVTGRPPAFAATELALLEIEQTQHLLGEGPAFDARRTGSWCLGGDATWRRFGPRAGRAGFHSMLAHPIPNEISGAWITLYAKTDDAFDPSLGSALAEFGRLAAVQLTNVQLLIRTRHEADQANRERTEGAVIERAVGVLMSRRGIDADAALDRLRVLSQQDNIKLLVAAGRLLDEAVNRARTRGERTP